MLYKMSHQAPLASLTFRVVLDLHLDELELVGQHLLDAEGLLLFGARIPLLFIN